MDALISIAVNYFPELKLLPTGRYVGFHCVKTGDWVVESIDQARCEFKSKTILFHQNCIVAETEQGCRELARQLQGWQQYTGSPWVSSHLDYYTIPERQAHLQYDAPLPRISEREGLERLCLAAAAVQSLVSVPLILENMPNRVVEGVLLGPTPDLIGQMLASSDCGLLLDLAHARISAQVLRMDVHRYIESLPLHRVVELHVSGPRREQGYLRDRHDALGREDYRLLEWVLPRCRPQALTLEYWKDLGLVGVQLRRLAAMTGTVFERTP